MDDPIERRRIVAAAEAKLFGSASGPVCVGRFELRRRIGAGGLGVVYAAHDPELDRTVALKILRANRSAGAEADRERILDEARAMARIAHPNVAVVHEVGVHKDRVFLAMELVEGGTLRTWLAERREWTAALAMLTDAGRGLVAAHAAGLVHRDFKPENVLVDGERPRVADFGLAVAASAKATPAGTPAYMAPEQHAGLPALAAADQFAFCVTAWEALAGRRPFAEADLATLVAAKERGDIVAPPEDPVPRRIWRALRRGLAPRPEDRWPSMAALLDALTPDPKRRTRRLVTGVVVAVALAVALAAAILQMRMFADWTGRARATPPPAATPPAPAPS